MTKRAAVFPGQGAQHVGMGKELAESDPDILALFNQASDVLGFDLAQVCFEGPEEELTKSSRAQPAIFVVSVAAYTALKKARPDYNFEAAAGLSSGEWCALYMAGAVSYADTLKALEARGRYMQEACEQASGSMLSVIGLSREQLESICAEADIEIANLNSPEQTVLSGKVEGIEQAEELAKAAGAKRAIRLNVAGAFHSKLMQPAQDQFAEALSEITFSAPEIPVWSNVTGGIHEHVEGMKSRMTQQITGSVHWVDIVQDLLGQGVETFVEMGPGKVLSGLIKRIDKQASLHNIQDSVSLGKCTESMNKET
jgi:[acyl-carrier-protein] S-malonyltransferase